jgi:sporadic carbohydrate cluster 2OG-Fe(II) oxygenase/sporadic carbohydrate cluster protein (TIGR04323 family)
MITELERFDVGTLDYDLERYPLDRWVLTRVQERGYEVEDVSQLHEVLPLQDLPALTKGLIKDTFTGEFRDMVVSLIDEYIRPMLNADIAIQRYPNIRVVLPARPDMILPFHQGIWVGNGLNIGTVWLPLSPAYDTNSMQIIGLETSKRLTIDATQGHWSREKMQEEFMKHSDPVNLNPGQACLFNQANIHGNIPNETGVTRMSIDYRVLERDGQFHRKIPGGYFVVNETGEGESNNGSGKYQDRAIISYNENNTRMTRGIPIYLQRLALRDYCLERDIKFRYEQVELEGLYHCPILMGVLQHDNADDVILFSVYALPEDSEHRKAILDAALENGVVLHFVNELEVMRNESDRERVEAVLDFSRNFSSPVAA